MSDKNRFNKTVLYFNYPKSHPYVNYTQFRGSKLKLKNQNRILDLKTKYIDRSRYQKNEEGQIQETQQVPFSKSKYSSLNSLRKKNSLMNSSIDSYRQKKEPSVDMMISPQSNQQTRETPRQFPRFQSSNLQGKMNEYLNILIQKSQHQQQEKSMATQIEPENKKNVTQNNFLRKMKIYKKKKLNFSISEHKDEQDISLIARKTIGLLKERQYGKIPLSKISQFYNSN